jgi:hypothetical protein
MVRNLRIPPQFQVGGAGGKGGLGCRGRGVRNIGGVAVAERQVARLLLEPHKQRARPKCQGKQPTNLPAPPANPARQTIFRPIPSNQPTSSRHPPPWPLNAPNPCALRNRAREALKGECGSLLGSPRHPSEALAAHRRPYGPSPGPGKRPAVRQPCAGHAPVMRRSCAGAVFAPCFSAHTPVVGMPRQRRTCAGHAPVMRPSCAGLRRRPRRAGGRPSLGSRRLALVQSVSGRVRSRRPLMPRSCRRAMGPADRNIHRQGQASLQCVGDTAGRARQ